MVCIGGKVAEVIQIVVRAVAVLVIDNLSGLKKPTERLLHHEPVFPDIAVAIGTWVIWS